MRFIRLSVPLLLAAGLATACSPTSKAPPDPAASQLQTALVANRCSACHTVETGLIGPSMREIAARYGDSDDSVLTASILNGSTGKWGTGRMPAQRHLTHEQATQIVRQMQALASARQGTP